MQWVGDSLDGTLARVRGIERPTYGYYLDHLVDALATAAIGIGLGLSPYMLLSVGTLIVVAYLILSINVYLESFAFNRFSIGYGKIGPTEIRLILILLNTFLALDLVGLDFNLVGLDLTVFDLVGLGIAGTMIVLLVGRSARNLRELAEARAGSPAKVKRPILPADVLANRPKRTPRGAFGRSYLSLGELAAEDLAGGGLRDLVDPLDQPDPLLRRDLLGDVLHDLVVADLGRDDDEGLRQLAASSSGTPITAQSAIAGWVIRIASSSAGGTWKPLYLISSLSRSTIA